MKKIFTYGQFQLLILCFCCAVLLQLCYLGNQLLAQQEKVDYIYQVLHDPGQGVYSEYSELEDQAEINRDDLAESLHKIIQKIDSCRQAIEKKQPPKTKSQAHAPTNI